MSFPFEVASSSVFTPIHLDVAGSSDRLCFVHLMKTAGASIGAYLESQFHLRACCPAWNPLDFDQLDADELAGYQLVRGHLIGRQRVQLPAGTQTLTILRHPLDRLVSAYRWLREIDDAYWTRVDQDAHVHGRPLTTDPLIDGREETEHCSRFARTHSFEQFLRATDPLVRTWTENLAYAQLTPHYQRNRHPPDTTQPVRRLDHGAWSWNYANRRLPRLFQQARVPLARRLLDEFTLIGTHELLRQTLEVLCWRRAWPAPAELPRFNLRAGDQIKVDAAARRLIEKRNALDIHMHALACARIEAAHAALQREAGGLRQIARFLDDNHLRAARARLRPLDIVNLQAADAWPGRGWGMREINEHGQSWRAIGQDGSASVLVELARGDHYVFTAYLQTASAPEVARSLTAHLHGHALRPGADGFLGGYYFRHWLIDKDALDNAHGIVEIELRIPEAAAGHLIAISRLTCRPYAGGS